MVLDRLDVEPQVGDAVVGLDHVGGAVGGDRDARGQDRQRAARLVAQAGERVAPVGEREVDRARRPRGSRWRRGWRAARRS